MHTTDADIFSRWQQACEASPWDSLSAEAAAPYRYIWNSWCTHLASTPWQDASAIQVLTFINSAAPPGKDKPSEITRRRYWRVLDRIYDFAVLHEVAPSNPAQDVHEADRPPAEDPQGAILSPRLWHALRQQFPASSKPIDIRDKAIVLTLADAAPTPAELTALTLEDVLLEQPEPRLRILGELAHQRREVPISPECAQALGNWLSTRDRLGPGPSPALFVARGEPLLKAQALQRITRLHLSYSAIVAGLPMPLRFGPQVFRNTAIVRWLHEGVSIIDTMRLAGVKSPAALAHLRAHLPSTVRMAISASSPE